MNKNDWQTLDSYLCMQEIVLKDIDHSLVLVSKEVWYSLKEDSPQGIWVKLAEKMLIEFPESGCPIFCATTPLSRGQLKSKGHGKLSIHFAAVQETIETFAYLSVLSSSVFTEQLQKCVKNLKSFTTDRGELMW